MSTQSSAQQHDTSVIAATRPRLTLEQALNIRELAEKATNSQTAGRWFSYAGYVCALLSIIGIGFTFIGIDAGEDVGTKLLIIFMLISGGTALFAQAMIAKGEAFSSAVAIATDTVTEAEEVIAARLAADEKEVHPDAP